MSKLKTLTEHQEQMAKESVRKFGLGKLVKSKYPFNGEQERTLIASDKYPRNMDVFHFTTNGNIFRVGFFTGQGTFVHVTKSKEYFIELQEKYGTKKLLNSRQEDLLDEGEDFFSEFEEIFK